MLLFSDGNLEDDYLLLLFSDDYLGSVNSENSMESKKLKIALPNLVGDLKSQSEFVRDKRKR